MIDFSGHDVKAREIALHYAASLQDQLVLDLVAHDKDIDSEEQAIALARFYWQMLDQSALDAEQGLEVCGQKNNQFWMERLLNIIGGYLQRRGYGHQWQSVCDDA